MRGQARYRAAKSSFIDGVYFPSKKEAKRYGALKLMVQAGEIESLTLHPRFALCVNGVRLGYYVADSRYIDRRTGQVVVEDVKGWRTEMYLWKKKHFEAQYGIAILEQ